MPSPAMTAMRCLFMDRFLGAHPGSAGALGAQASLPACFGQSAIAVNPAGKDACAPRAPALPGGFSFFMGVAMRHERDLESYTIGHWPLSYRRKRFLSCFSMTIFQ